jgi:hypothetical protein
MKHTLGLLNVVVQVPKSLVCYRCRCKAAQVLFQLQQRTKASSIKQQQQQAGGHSPADDTAARLAQAQNTVGQLGEQALLNKLSALDQNIAKVLKAMPVNGMLMVVTGQGDTSDAVWQTELRYKRQQRLDGYQKWTTADEEAYAALSESAMKGLCFVVVKRPQ